MSKEKRIYERNPDTGEVRSRKFGDYGNERIEVKGGPDKFNAIQSSLHHELQDKVRKDVLSEIWAAHKVVHNGKWYVSLSEVCNIIGTEDE